MRLLTPILLLLCLLVLPSAQLPELEIPGGGTLLPGDQQPVVEEPFPAAGLTLAYSVLIENRSGGVIRVIEPPAQLLFNRPGDDVGMVTRPATRLGVGPIRSSIAARSVSHSALDELRLQLYSDDDTASSGELILLAADAGMADSLRSADAPGENVIQTNITRGRGIFGGKYPLTVGSPVYVYRAAKRISLTPGAEQLEAGDVIIIEVALPAELPLELVIENNEAGSVKLSEAAKVSELGSISQPAVMQAASQAGLAGRRAGIVACSPLGLRLLLAGGETPVELELKLQPGSGTDAGSASGPASPTSVADFIPDSQPPAAQHFAYLFPASGQEPPDTLPMIELLVQWKGSTAWLPPPLTFTAADLANITAFTLAWRDPLREPEVSRPLPGVEVAPADEPSLRGR
jgi:hypothetical protein